MKKINHFLQFIIIIFCFLLFKIIGLKLSRSVSKKIFSTIGPFFKSKKIIEKNLEIAFPKISMEDKENIQKKMWEYYGKVFAEYIFLSEFRKSISNKNIKVIGSNYIEKIKLEKKPVIFISGHFDNFELLAMQIEKFGINLAAIYRPLNNIFLNPIMEYLRKKYICKNQIKKGIAGTKDIVKFFKSGSSIALMIDQRVSQGILTKFFEKNAYTTTIPAQFVKKYNCQIAPVCIERNQDDTFNLEFLSPISFNQNKNIEEITRDLNEILEKMILKNPSQWIWTHNRWK
tara:strand:+ start:147 stop:1007 length:861 start_codon:yes stop_codon:yes gene_type:complete